MSGFLPVEESGLFIKKMKRDKQNITNMLSFSVF